MRQSLFEFLARKLNANKNSDVVGISLGLESISLCVLRKNQSEINLISHKEMTFHDWENELVSYVKENKLINAKCYLGFTSHHYQLVQIDKPKVPIEELHAALNWPVKELLGDESEFVYDYIESPAQVSGQQKVAVAAVLESEVVKAANVIYNAKLELVSMGVEELASIALLPKVNEPLLTLCQENGEEIILNIIKNSQLYFTRRIKGFGNLGSYSKDELRMGLIDNLCVQIQRSMDFFESQLRQAPIRHIRLHLDTPLQNDIIELITQTMDIKVEQLSTDLAFIDEDKLREISLTSVGSAYSHFTSESLFSASKGEAA